MNNPGKAIKFACSFLAAAAVCVLLVQAPCPALEKEAARVQQLIKNAALDRSALPKNARVEVTLRDAPEFSRLSGYELKTAFPGNRQLSGDVVVPVEAYSGIVLKDKINVRAFVRIYGKVVVASSRIRQGDIFTLQNASYAEKDLTYQPANFLSDISQAVGRQSSTFIPKGALVLDWMPREIPAVKRGQNVELFKTVNGVFVKTRAVAVEDGFINGTIRVKNSESGKMVEGRVISSGEVQAI